MSDVSNFSAIEALRDGRRVEVRAVKPDDSEAMLAAVAGASADSLYRRFFGVRRNFSDQEIEYFSNVDFIDHVALVAVADEDGQSAIVGGARYVVFEPGKAEVAFAITDRYQGQGLGPALMRHLVAIAREAGLRAFTAEVLAGNSAMLKVFEKCGLRMQTRRESDVVHVEIDLD